MARLIKKFDKTAWNKFIRHINDDNVKQVAFQEWSSVDSHFIIESDNWALPCWLSGRPSEPFLVVSDGEWSKYHNWSSIQERYFESTHGTFYLESGKNYDIPAPIGKIRSLCKVELPFHQYHPEFAFIMELPGLREEIRPLGLDIGLPFMPDAVLCPEGEFINKYNRNSGDFSLERYLSSSSRLLPGYATSFDSVNQNDILRYISSGDYIFKNEYIERMQYLAFAEPITKSV